MDWGVALPIIGPATGWAAFLGLAIYVVRGYTTGATLTRREADGIEKRNTYLESALEKSQAAEAASAAALAEEQKINPVIQRFFETLNRGIAT